ncbi:ArsR/SmtB family transcription factor [Spirosoma harenae]
MKQLANMLKAVGHPLRIQLVSIIAQERMVSISTLQQYLPDIDHFTLYSNLRFMHKKHIVRQRRKGREVYYALSELAIREGFDIFFRRQSELQLTLNDN